MEALPALLALVDEVTGSKSNAALFTLAKVYAQLHNWNGEELLGQLTDKNFWDVQYLDPSGNTPGMDSMDAFRCLVDVNRTRPLIKGITEVVKSKIESGIERPVAIDAGTGTGILALALIAAGCAKVHALEINEHTARTAMEFVKLLNLSEWIEVIQCDATQVDLGDVKADILVSENLSNGLFDEPQYRIINHLSSYLKPGATIIPASAEVMVSLGYTSWEGLDKTWSNVRKIPDLVRLTSPVIHTRVESEVGMAIPHITGEVVIGYPEDFQVANALIVSTRFRISDGVYLEPDTAEFLGKSSAFKTNGELHPGQPVRVIMSYPTEMRKQYAQVTTSDNVIILVPSEDYVS